MVLFCVYFKCLVYFHSFHVVPTSFSLALNDFKDLYSWWCSRNKTFTHTNDRCIWWICCMSQYSFYFVLFSLSLTRLVSFTGKGSGSNTRLQQWLQKNKSQNVRESSPSHFSQSTPGNTDGAFRLIRTGCWFRLKNLNNYQMDHHQILCKRSSEDGSCCSTG